MIVPTEADPASFCRWRMVWQKPHEQKQLFLSSETACFGMVQVGEVVDSNGRWARNMLHVLLPRKPTRFGVSESWDVVGLFAEWLGWWTSSVGYQAQLSCLSSLSKYTCHIAMWLVSLSSWSSSTWSWLFWCRSLVMNDNPVHDLWLRFVIMIHHTSVKHVISRS